VQVDACTVIAHNLLRAAGTIAGGDHAVARGATLRRDLVTVPARFAAPASRRCTCPRNGPGKSGGKPCGTTLSDTVPRSPVRDERHLPHPRLLILRLVEKFGCRASLICAQPSYKDQSD
jgi:hypothetical protein